MVIFIHVDCVRLFLHRHADIESKSKYIYNGSWSALVVACQRGHVDCVRELLDRHADIESKISNSGLSALFIAAYLVIDYYVRDTW